MGFDLPPAWRLYLDAYWPAAVAVLVIAGAAVVWHFW